MTQARRKAAALFGDSHASLLGSLADQASIAIENGVLFRRLEHEATERARQALHDPLTGLPNRAKLTELLATALEEAYENRGRVGLIVVDLDSFSQVVDAFGHRSADGLIIQACSRIKGLLPETALLARLGGEQFAIVMPDVADADEVIGAPACSSPASTRRSRPRACCWRWASTSASPSTPRWPSTRPR